MNVFNVNTISDFRNNRSSNENSNNTNRYTIQDNSLIVSLLINTIISLATLLAFCIVRKRFKSFYQYRVEDKSSVNKYIKQPERNGFFSWIIDTLKFNNKDIIKTSGLDSYMYLKNLKTNLKIIITIMIIGWLMLFPTNSMGRYNENRKVDNNGQLPDPVIGLSILSMANIERGSNLLWVHFLFVFIVTLIVLKYTHSDYKEYTELRIEFKESNRLMNYSILLRDIPVSLFNKNEIINYFKKYLPSSSEEEVGIKEQEGTLSKISNGGDNNILDVSLQYPIKGIHSLIDEREYYVKRRDSMVSVLNKTRVRPTRKRGLLGLFGNKVDSIDFYDEKIKGLDGDIEKLKLKSQKSYQDMISKESKSGSGKSNKSAGNGFIVFKHRATQKQLVQTVMRRRDSFLLTRYPAMDPHDVYWPNIQIGGKSLYMRRFIVVILTLLLTFFYSIPVTLIASVSNLGTLSKVLPWLVVLINKSSTLTGFLTGFLPSLALIIFMTFLVPILKLFSIWRGHYSNSAIEASVFSKYFLFLVFNVFLVSAIAGTIFQSIGAIINNPPSITMTLANSLGGLSYAMINYVLLAATALTMNLLRLSDLLIMIFKLKFLCHTKRETEEAQESENFKYGQLYAYNLLVLQLCFAYCTLSPFILIFGVWYFGVSYLVHKYNIIWVNRPHITQLLYPMSFRRTIIGLLIYHLLMIGTFNIYSFWYGSLIFIPFILTILFWIHCEYTFYSVSKHGLLDNYNENNENNGKSSSINNNDDNDENIASGSGSDKNKIEEIISLLPSVVVGSEGNRINYVEDTITYSINDYNENLYKPPYFRELMQPEEIIENDYIEIVNSKPPNFIGS